MAALLATDFDTSLLNSRVRKTARRLACVVGLYVYISTKLMLTFPHHPFQPMLSAEEQEHLEHLPRSNGPRFVDTTRPFFKERAGLSCPERDGSAKRWSPVARTGTKGIYLLELVMATRLICE